VRYASAQNLECDDFPAEACESRSTAMPGPTEGDEELEVDSDKSERPTPEVITTISMSEVTLQLSPRSLVVHVDELAAAFQKLGITNVSATEVFNIVREEQAHKHKAPVERGEAVLHREPIPLHMYENLTSSKCLLQVLLSRVKHKSGGFLPTHRPL
jgi:hypothetical protein